MITNLPIESIRHKLLESLHACKRFVLSAPTGSGKSTQVPQMLLDGHPELKGAIFVLQPRRLAARMLAKRVAFERKKYLALKSGFKSVSRTDLPLTQRFCI